MAPQQKPEMQVSILLIVWVACLQREKAMGGSAKFNMDVGGGKRSL